MVYGNVPKSHAVSLLDCHFFNSPVEVSTAVRRTSTFFSTFLHANQPLRGIDGLSRERKTRFSQKHKRTQKPTTTTTTPQRRCLRPQHRAPLEPSAYWAALHPALTSARNAGGTSTCCAGSKLLLPLVAMRCTTSCARIATMDKPNNNSNRNERSN